MVQKLSRALSAQNALRKQLCEQSSSIKTGHLESMHKAHEVAIWGSRVPPRMQPQDVVPPRCPVCTIHSTAQAVSSIIVQVQ